MAALTTCWYNTDDPRCTKFPKLYGTIVSATDLSACVYWDTDENTSSIATSKLEHLPVGTPFQIDPEADTSDHDRSIFQPKSKRKKSVKKVHKKSKAAVIVEAAKKELAGPSQVKDDLLAVVGLTAT